MKIFRYTLISLFTITSLIGFAQVQVDKAIQLTGSGANAKVSGIQNITSSQDAVNADAVINNTLTFASSTGSSNAYAITLSSAITSYTTGMVVQFIANFANTGVATLNVNGLGAKTIKKNYNSDLINTDIKSGQAVIAMYDGTNFQMLSQSGNGSGTSLAHGKQIFYCVGGPQYFTVPDGVTSIDVKLWGAAGGSSASGSDGGTGAFVHGTLTVTPNTFLTIVVGQSLAALYTGSNGTGGVRTYGGGGYSWNGNSGVGGGRSAVQVSSVDVVTAGGGGGAAFSDQTGYGQGGGGGAPDGAAGLNSSGCGSDGAGGGTTSIGGAGGTDCDDVFDGSAGAPSAGGNPNVNTCCPPNWAGGGGGGGYYGGGGGAGGTTAGGGGGGGGSSYTSDPNFTLISNQAGQTGTNGSQADLLPGGSGDSDYQTGVGSVYGSSSNGTQNGNGLVIITW